MVVVVIAEDDADLLAAFTRVLTRAGHSVVACCDGDSALTQIRTQRPDLVLTDVDMPPGMSGWIWLPRSEPTPWPTGSPVIVATGGRIRAEVAAAFGVTLLLRKPIPPSALVAHVEAVLASSRDTPSAADPVG